MATVSVSKGKIIIRDGRKTALAAGEIVNGRPLVRVPREFADTLRRGYNGHIVMTDESGMCSAPSASQAKKMLKDAGVPSEAIKAAFGHLR